MYNITRGNTIPMKAILEHDGERFPVAVSTNISVRAYNEYRYINAENVTVDQEEDGVLYFEIPPTLNTGIFGVEVKGNVNGVSWRTATDGVVKITGATQRNEGSEAVPEGDTYDIVMKVQLYKNQSSDKAIEEHNSDEASHPYILGELERIEGEIPTLPEHIVTDANYVHTDNNYTTEEKTKLANAITEEQDPTVPQWAKQSTKPSYTPQEVGALPANTPLFDGDYNSLSNKPDLSGFITISVNNLVNYYLKSETYTKSEVQGLIAAIQQFHYEIYASISAVTSPAGNVLYLIGPTGTGADKYEEYVYDATKQEPWVKIGDTSIDLSDYYTKGQTDNAITSALNTALANYTTTAALTLLLAGKQDVINDLATIRSGASAGATAYQKPAGGIPKTDLAQGVQDSLDKADTALQEDTLYEDANGHDYVEIGGMKWATKNVGANAVTDAGLYFQWGDTQGYTAEQVGTGEGKKAFTWADYKYGNGTSSPGATGMTKYNATDGLETLELEDDAARANWGGSWRMPTTEEMQAFGAAVNAVWTDDYQGSGVAGLVCTDKTDNTKVVFFPAAGDCDNGVEGVGNLGRYLSSSLDSSDLQVAYGLYFSYVTYWNDYSDRCYGCTVRPILDTTQLKKDLDSKANTEDLADVAFSGSYNDLDDKPTIPTVPTNVSAFNNDAGYLTQHQDISGKADKSEMSVTDGTGTDADKTTITLKTGTSATVLKSHQSLSGKQDVIDSSHKLSADLVDDTNTTNKFTNDTEKQTWNGKQDALVSGTNIKTINNESVLGSGNITIQGGGGSQVQSDWNQSDNTAVDYIKNKPTIPVIPSNLAYTSNDNGEGIIPSDGIRAVTVTNAATMTISPDVVTIIDGAVGTAAITLQVPQDNLAHVWDILLTTDSTVAITFAMSNSATILTPSGFSIGASKAVEISVIGVGTKYYLRYGEFA